MTKAAFIEAYRARLIALYPWTADAAKLERFMASVAETLAGPAAKWNHDGPAVTAAWREIGGKGKPTRTALRALA